MLLWKIEGMQSRGERKTKRRRETCRSNEVARWSCKLESTVVCCKRRVKEVREGVCLDFRESIGNPGTVLAEKSLV